MTLENLLAMQARQTINLSAHELPDSLPRKLSTSQSEFSAKETLPVETFRNQIETRIADEVINTRCDLLGGYAEQVT